MSKDIFNKTRLLRASLNLILNISRAGSSTNFPGNPLQHLTTLITKNFCLICGLNQTPFSLKSLPLFLPQQTPLKYLLPPSYKPTWNRQHLWYWTAGPGSLKNPCGGYRDLRDIYYFTRFFHIWNIWNSMRAVLNLWIQNVSALSVSYEDTHTKKKKVLGWYQMFEQGIADQTSTVRGRASMDRAISKALRTNKSEVK